MLVNRIVVSTCNIQRYAYMIARLPANMLKNGKSDNEQGPALIFCLCLKGFFRDGDLTAAVMGIAGPLLSTRIVRQSADP
jgi:hypothetical protein